MGGKVVSKVTKQTTICLSNQGTVLMYHLIIEFIIICIVFEGEVDKMSKRMLEVEEYEVPVVDEDYLNDARSGGGALLKISSHTISSWGAPRHSLPSADMTDDPGHSSKSTGTH